MLKVGYLSINYPLLITEKAKLLIEVVVGYNQTGYFGRFLV
jgi:hypothetical protein